jgi:hypothetical protein
MGVKKATTKPATPDGASQPMKKAKKGAAKTAAKEAEVTSAKPLSALSAAARVLHVTGEAMTCPALIEAMKAKGYWTSPGGRTPAGTLHSALMREITQKGKEARFQKTGRGLFAHTGVA